MSSSGHVADMIARIEQNKALRGKSRRLYEVLGTYANTKAKKPLEWNSLTEEERVRLREQLENHVRIEKRKDLWAIGISLIIIILAISLLFPLL